MVMCKMGRTGEVCKVKVGSGVQTGGMSDIIKVFFMSFITIKKC